MAKIQHFKNPIHSAQNVGSVLISMEAQSIIQKGLISANTSRDFFGPGPTWALLGPLLLSRLSGQYSFLMGLLEVAFNHFNPTKL